MITLQETLSHELLERQSKFDLRITAITTISLSRSEDLLMLLPEDEVCVRSPLVVSVLVMPGASCKKMNSKWLSH